MSRKTLWKWKVFFSVVVIIAEVREENLMEINLNGKIGFAGNIFKCERFCEAIIIKCRRIHSSIVSFRSILLLQKEAVKLISKYD